MQNLSNANGSLSGGGGLAMTSLKPCCRMADGDAFHAEPRERGMSCPLTESVSGRESNVSCSVLHAV